MSSLRRAALVIVLALVASVGLTVSADAEPATAAATFSTAPTPKIAGTTRVGSTLTAKPGTWKPKAKLKYQWYRGGSAIKGATKSTYRLVAADKGKTIKVKVIGSKAGYASKSKTSKATKKVAAALPPAPRLVNGERKVRAGLSFVDVDRNVTRTKSRVSMDDAIVAAGGGGAVVYQAYNTVDGSARDYSLEWRSLASGRSLTLTGVWNYGLDISANGRWVVYIDGGGAAGSGMVTSFRFWLWDTKTNTRKRIDVRSNGKPTTDAERSFCERAIDISDNGAWVVFSASAPSLNSKAKDSFTSFAYQRSTGKVTAVPYKKGRSADCARVSDNGKVALFPGWGGGDQAQLWNLATGKVRAIAPGGGGWSSAEPAAISADGSTLVYLSSVVTITRLGNSAATDRVDDVAVKGWKELGGTAGVGYADSSAGEPVISKNGDSVSFMTSRAKVKLTCADDGWCSGEQLGEEVFSLRHLNVRTGTQSTLSAPGAVTWLPLGKKSENYVDARVSMSADGASTYAVACSRGSQVNPFRVCSNRSDLFRWVTK